MNAIVPRLLAGLVLFGAVGLAACSDDETVNTDTAKEQAQTAGQQAQSAAQTASKDVKEAWSGMRVDSDRLLDRIQARNDPDAKKELLDKCRNTQEKIAKSDNARAGTVNQLCDRIRDTDVNSRDAWNQIKDQVNQLNQQIGS